MAVGVGSFSDPEHLQGLSHYLEHMLFMGSEKFPNENEYDEYLTKHGGSCNAFTDMVGGERTCCVLCSPAFGALAWLDIAGNGAS